MQIQIDDLLADVLGNGDRSLQAGLRQQESELLTADPCNHVAGPGEALRHRLRDDGQTMVACRVSVAIVELLEVIDIRRDHRQGLAIAACPAPLLGEFLLKQPSVRNTRQGVAPHHALERMTRFDGRCKALPEVLRVAKHAPHLKRRGKHRSTEDHDHQAHDEVDPIAFGEHPHTDRYHGGQRKTGEGPGNPGQQRDGAGHHATNHECKEHLVGKRLRIEQQDSGASPHDAHRASARHEVAAPDGRVETSCARRGTERASRSVSQRNDDHQKKQPGQQDRCRDAPHNTATRITPLARFTASEIGSCR